MRAHWLSFVLPLLAVACGLTDADREVDYIKLEPSGPRIDVGAGMQMRAEAHNRAGDVIRDARFTWTSSNSYIASITSTGYVTGRNIGQSTIGVTSGQAARSTTVYVGMSAPPPGTDWGIGSCPLVYSWDGRRWRLDSGTFGGALAPALARTDVDLLEHATAAGGRLRLRMTNELHEIEHVNAVEVVAVDHAPGTVAVPDPAGGIHLLRMTWDPVSARDMDGRDASPLIAQADGRAWESVARARDPSRPQSLRDGVVLTFRRPADARRIWLVVDAQNTVWATNLLGRFLDAQGAAVNAWYASLRIGSVRRAVQRRFIREAFLHVDVERDGRWSSQGFLWEAGPEVMKRQAIPVDLAGVRGDTVRVRLTAPPSFWRIDAVGLALDVAGDEAGGAGARRATPTTLSQDAAGGGAPRATSTTTVLPLLAAFTAGRDVRSELAGRDHRELTMRTGDEVELVFGDKPRAAATIRTYFLRSTGWYRMESRSRGFPEVATLARLAFDRDGLARMAVERSNAALRAARRGRYAER